MYDKITPKKITVKQNNINKITRIKVANTNQKQQINQTSHLKQLNTSKC